MPETETVRRHFSLTTIEEEIFEKITSEMSLRHSEAFRRMVDYYRRTNAEAMRSGDEKYIDNLYRQTCYSLAGISPTRTSDPFEPTDASRDAEVAELL